MQLLLSLQRQTYEITIKSKNIMNKILLSVMVLLSLCQATYARKQTNMQAVTTDSGAVIKVNGKTVVSVGAQGASVEIDDSMIDAIDSAFTDTGFCDETVAHYVEELTDDLDEECGDQAGFLINGLFDQNTNIAMGIFSVFILIFLTPLLFIIGIIIIVWLYMRNRRKKQQIENDLIKALAENGQDVSQYLNRQRPAETHRVVEYRTVNHEGQTTSSRVTTEKTPDERFDKGIRNTIIGGAITFVCWFFHWAEIFLMGGMILLAVGISQMITAKNAMSRDMRGHYHSDEPTDRKPQDETTDDSSATNP